MSIKKVVILSYILLATASGLIAEAPPSAKDHKLMQGFLPLKDKRVDKSNWLAPPFNRWGFQNISQFHNTANIYRGNLPVRELERKTLDLDGLVYKNREGKTLTFREMLDATYTDGIVVLRKGNIVYERYFNDQQPQTRHIMFSATKSLVGTVAAVLVHQGMIDPKAKVSNYVSELEGSAFGDATVREVMDMTTAIQYSEDYTDLQSEVVSHMIATNYRPIPNDYTGPELLYDFLPTLKKKGEHGNAFHYVSANTEVLAWLVKRATGKSVIEIFSDNIWSKLGTERDGYIITDRAGQASWGGGFVGTLRDMARFGQMMLQFGQVGDFQLVPSEVVEDIRNGSSREAFAKSDEGKPGEAMEGWSYRNQWWVSHNEHGAYTALGIYGQWIYVDPKAQMVIAIDLSK